MLRIHTKISASEAQAILAHLATDSREFTGSIGGDTFRLHTKPMLRRLPVTYFGRIFSDGDGTQIRVWSLPALGGVIGLVLIICLIKLQDFAPSWIIYFGLVGFIISYIIETRRGYDSLRQTFVV